MVMSDIAHKSSCFKTAKNILNKFWTIVFFTYVNAFVRQGEMYKKRQNKVWFNPLNATGAHMHHIPMLTDNCGIERVKQFQEREHCMTDLLQCEKHI